MPSEVNSPIIRAALYARVSSDLQSPASIADQLRVCAERAAKEAWEVVESYIDQGISGATLIRPGIRKPCRMPPKVRHHSHRVPRPRLQGPGGHRRRDQARPARPDRGRQV